MTPPVNLFTCRRRNFTPLQVWQNIDAQNPSEWTKVPLCTETLPRVEYTMKGMFECMRVFEVAETNRCRREFATEKYGDKIIP